MTDAAFGPRYGLAGHAADLMDDNNAFASFSQAVRANLTAQMGSVRQLGPHAERELQSTLLYLNVLEKRFDAALANIYCIRSLSEKPAVKQTAHVVAECIIRATCSGGDVSHALRARLEEVLEQLPWSLVGGEIKRLRADLQILNLQLVNGLIEATFKETHSVGQSLDEDGAALIIRMRFYRDAVLPHREELKAALNALISDSETLAEDVWIDRSVSLANDPVLSKVVIGIWDSGLDVDQFAGRMANSGGASSLAWDGDARRSAHPLRPLSSKQLREYPSMIDLVRGFGDTRLGSRSSASELFERKMAALDPEDVTAFLEELELIADYIHGTHVASVAVAGNPFALLLSVRVTWEHRFTVNAFTHSGRLQEQAALYRESVRFLRKGGARVVNMSWNRSPSFFLGQRELFERDREALRRALATAKDVLFVVAAGNVDQNVVLSEFYPASFDLPNLIVVGAADRGGNVASFSNFGASSMVYANGYDVMGLAPGNQTIPMSGTSVAAAHVTCIAGKVLATRPLLRPDEVICAIVRSAHLGSDGVRMVDERATMALLSQ